jgi:hypothetical protein
MAFDKLNFHCISNFNILPLSGQIALQWLGISQVCRYDTTHIDNICEICSTPFIIDLVALLFTVDL